MKQQLHFLIILLLASCNTNNAEKSFKDGLPLFKKGHYEEAQKLFKQAIENGYKNYEAYYYLSKSMASLGDWQSSLNSFHKALVYSHDIDKDYIVLAKMHVELNNWDSSLYYCSNVGNIENSLEHRLHNIRGMAYQGLEKYDEALEQYLKSVNANPEYYYAYYGIGYILYKQKRFKEADSLFSKSLEINDKHIDSYGMRGLTREYLGLNKKALLDYSKALNIRPKDVKMLTNRGALLCNSDDFDNGIIDLYNAINLAENRASRLKAMYLLSVAYKDVNNMDKACKIVERMIQLLPDPSGYVEVTEIDNFTKHFCK